MPRPAHEGWLSTEEAASYLGVPVSQIRTWRRAGLLKPDKPHGPKSRCRYRPQDLDEFMERSRV